MFLPSWNESDPVSLDSFLVLSGLVQCLLRVSSLPFDIVIDLKVKATSSNILTRAFYPEHIYHILWRNICYLPAGRSVWWKTVLEVLKILPEAVGRGQHFQDRGHSFSPYGPTLSRWITYLFFLNLTKFFPREPELWLWFKRLPNKLWNIMFASICHDLTTVN